MDILQFWDLTYGEIILYLDTYNERKLDETRTQATLIYQLGALVAKGISIAINGGDFPAIYDVFPELFESEREAVEKEQWQAERNKWLAMAQAHNAKVKEAKKT